jgi:hypothetical protein
MRSLTTTIIAFALAGALSGCASTRIPFTHEIRTQYKLTEAEVKNLQFYTSDSIKLHRELTATDRQVTGGHRLVLTSGKVVEEVVIEKETPGVAVALSRDTIAVSFDVGSQLEFSLRTGELSAPPPPPDPDHRFAQAPDPFPGQSRPEPEHSPELDGLLGKYYLKFQAGTSQVPFQGQLFEALADSYKAHLLIDSDKLDDEVKNRTVLPGRTLDAESGAGPRVKL